MMWQVHYGTNLKISHGDWLRSPRVLMYDPKTRSWLWWDDKLGWRRLTRASCPYGAMR